MKHKELEEMLKQYTCPIVVNKVNDVLTLPPIRSERNFNTSVGLETVLSHEGLMYPSERYSQEILNKNKDTFHKMYTTLKWMEKSQLKKIKNVVIKEKLKLKYLHKIARKKISSN